MKKGYIIASLLVVILLATSCVATGPAPALNPPPELDGNLITTSSDAVMNLERGETWKFTISCTGAGCDRVKTYQVTATAASSYRGF